MIMIMFIILPEIVKMHTPTSIVRVWVLFIIAVDRRCVVHVTGWSKPSGAFPDTRLSTAQTFMTFNRSYSAHKRNNKKRETTRKKRANYAVRCGAHARRMRSSGSIHNSATLCSHASECVNVSPQCTNIVFDMLFWLVYECAARSRTETIDWKWNDYASTDADGLTPWWCIGGGGRHNWMPALFMNMHMRVCLCVFALMQIDNFAIFGYVMPQTHEQMCSWVKQRSGMERVCK